MGNKKSQDLIDSNHPRTVGADSNLQWNSIVFDSMSPQSVAQLAGNGLNMFKLTLFLTPVHDNGAGAKPPVYVSPEVLRQSITLIDYDQSQITALTYLPSAPTIENLPRFSGWAYTDGPNDFVVNPSSGFDLAEEATGSEADASGQQAITFYVMCKSQTDSNIRIGYQIQPTDGAKISDYINGTNGFKGHYVEAQASAEEHYTQNDLTAAPQYMPHPGDDDDFSASTEMPDGLRWRQYNYTIDINQYSGPIYYTVSPTISYYSVDDIDIYQSCKSINKNGYLSSLYIWNAEMSGMQYVPISNVSDGHQIDIGENPRNRTFIRITVIFSNLIGSYYPSSTDNNNIITFYDSTGKSGQFSISTELPNYVQLRYPQQGSSSWNPIAPPRGNQEPTTADNAGSYYLISDSSTYLGCNADNSVVIINNITDKNVNTSFYSLTDELIRCIKNDYYLCISNPYQDQTNFPGSYEIISAYQITNSSNYIKFTFKPIWKLQAFGIFSNVRPLYLGIDTVNATGTNGQYQAYLGSPSAASFTSNSGNNNNSNNPGTVVQGNMIWHLSARN